jgi:hypothetical protein
VVTDSNELVMTPLVQLLMECLVFDVSCATYCWNVLPTCHIVDVSGSIGQVFPHRSMCLEVWKSSKAFSLEFTLVKGIIKVNCFY